MNNLKRQVLQRVDMWKTSEETQRSHNFETNEMVLSIGIGKGKENISL